MADDERPSFLGFVADLEAMPDGPAKFIGQAAVDGSTFSWKLDRTEIVEGVTFSRPAMEAVFLQIHSFIECRVMARWDRTGEPPSHLDIKIEVDAG